MHAGDTHWKTKKRSGLDREKACKTCKGLACCAVDAPADLSAARGFRKNSTSIVLPPQIWGEKKSCDDETGLRKQVSPLSLQVQLHQRCAWSQRCRPRIIALSLHLFLPPEAAENAP
jgi:hypothetical protein